MKETTWIVDPYTGVLTVEGIESGRLENPGRGPFVGRERVNFVGLNADQRN